MATMNIAIQNAAATKGSRAWSCLFLLFALLLLGSCNESKTKDSEGGDKSRHLTNPPVPISNCNPASDPVIVQAGTPMVWFSQDNPYTITFKNKTNPNSNPPNLNITPPASSVFYPTTKIVVWDTTGTPSDCGDTVSTTAVKGCLFKYSISKEGQVCKDPGVHVIPTGDGMGVSNK